MTARSDRRIGRTWTSTGEAGSKRAITRAISCWVVSLTSCPTSSPSGETPMSTRPPSPLRNPQSVSPARGSWAVERFNSTVSDSPPLGTPSNPLFLLDPLTGIPPESSPGSSSPTQSYSPPLTVGGASQRRSRSAAPSPTLPGSEIGTDHHRSCRTGREQGLTWPGTLMGFRTVPDVLRGGKPSGSFAVSYLRYGSDLTVARSFGFPRLARGPTPCMRGASRSGVGMARSPTRWE
jgi:hypothetical protein